ncbi:MAG: metallophosphoesterase family protein [Myxococcota bacterium]
MLFLLVGCIGLNVNAVPTQDIYADDGDTKDVKGRVEFAVVGDVRPGIPGEQGRGRVFTPDTEAAIVKDISAAVQDESVDFVVLLGDLVTSSSTGEWKGFSRDWSLVLSGSELPETGTLRTRVVPVAGNHDRIGDEWLKGFGAAFPGVGQDIGFNRVASWYAFDLDVGKATWRMMVLDSSKGMLGSRWDEQMAWIPKALEGDYDGLLVFMHHPRWTLAKGQMSDEGAAPSELLAAVDDATKIGALKAVFSGHAHTNEVYLPGGKYGEMYVVAGGGGSPADTVKRWGRVGQEDLKLESIYDLALMKEFDRWIEPKGISEQLQEKAKGDGSWKGFDAEIDAAAMPIQGWWNVALVGDDMELSFRMVGADGQLKTIYTVNYDNKDGWKTGR